MSGTIVQLPGFTRWAAPRQLGGGTTPLPRSTGGALGVDRLALSGAAHPFAFPAQFAGKTVPMRGTIKGKNATGRAQIARSDADGLEMTFRASAMMGVVTATVHMKIERQGDGTYLGEATVLDSRPALPPDQREFSRKLRVTEERPGYLKLSSDQDEVVSATVAPDGSMTVRYLDDSVTLMP